MRRILVILALALSFFLPSFARADSDFEFWPALSIKALDTKYVDLVSFGQLRLRENGTDLFQYLLSQRVIIEPNDYLGLGVAYSYLPIKPPNDNDFKDRQRIEIEVIPKWPVNEWFSMELRNRLEVRWTEDVPGTEERSRHRLQFSFSFKDLKPLQGVYFSNEFFYDFEKNDYNQNRAVPVGLKFKLHDQVGFDLYYMIQSIKRATEWDVNHILGTQVSVTLWKK